MAESKSVKGIKHEMVKSHQRHFSGCLMNKHIFKVPVFFTDELRLSFKCPSVSLLFTKKELTPGSKMLFLRP